jgi:hypothetical protein
MSRERSHETGIGTSHLLFKYTCYLTVYLRHVESVYLCEFFLESYNSKNNIYFVVKYYYYYYYYYYHYHHHNHHHHRYLLYAGYLHLYS